MSKEDLKKHRTAYLAQKHGAKRRGIGWELTFDEWIEWWGDDICRRGVSRDSLQMQRFGDLGSYSIWNIKKGAPKQNGSTRANVVRTNKANKAKQDHEAFLDALMFAPSREDDDLAQEEEYFKPCFNGQDKTTIRAFKIDKR